MHDVAAGTVNTCPAAQAVQAVDPAADAKVPEGQIEQVVEPSSVNWPAGQAVQEVPDEVYEPTGQ